jgi:membrane-associated protease RseP (regulator of RpoE activity)
VGSVQALGSFFSPKSISNYGHQLSGGAPAKGATDSRPVSVVGVVRIADHAGVFDFFALLVMLNVFVAILNLVPLPPLDGGHIAIATYERIRSRAGVRYHADAQKLVPIAAAVLVLLVFLGATSIWQDIVHPIANPFR